MRVVILAGGRGERLAPLTNSIPKAMVVVNGKPMLEILLLQLRSKGIFHVVVVTHHLEDQIKSYFGTGGRMGMSIKYIHQSELKGNAHALLACELAVHDLKFMCIAVDSLFETDLLGRLAVHKADGVVTCKEVADPRRYGVLMTQGRKVLEIIEKPENAPTNLANFSVYILPQEIFSAIRQIKPSRTGELWLTDAINLLIKRGRRFEYEVAGQVLDIGTAQQLEEAQVVAKGLGL